MVVSRSMRFPFVLILMALAGTSCTTAPQATEESSAAANPSEAKDSTPTRPAISLGMTPEEVIKVIGRPEKIEAVTTPAGKGEEWFYRRLAKEWTEQTAATVNMVPAFVGLAMPNAGIGEAAVPGNQFENIKIHQVSSLLFIEGKLAAAKQWQEKEKRIQN